MGKDSIVWAQQLPDGGFASLRISPKVAELTQLDDFGTRPGDEFLAAAFDRYAAAGFTGVLDFAALYETASMVALEAQASEEAGSPASENASSRDSELLAWIDSIA